MGHVGARVRVAPLLLVNSSRDHEQSTHTTPFRAPWSGYSRANPWKAANEREPEVCAPKEQEEGEDLQLHPESCWNKNARQYDVAAARSLSVPTSGSQHARSSLENAGPIVN